MDNSNRILKRKRGNKNRKKNWRKNIDVSSVEDALDAQRLEIRTGGIISEKADADLFFIDKTAVKDHLPKSKRLREKRLRTDEIITPDPRQVKAPKRSGRVARHVKRNAEKKMKNKLNAPESDLPVTKEEKTFDLWGSSSLELYDKECKKNDITKYAETITGKRAVKRPKHLEKKPNDVERYKYRNVDTVEVAHPGASYNPTYNDHQNLLMKAHLVELKKVKEEERIERALHVPHDQLANPGDQEKAMLEGLFDEEGTDKEDDVMEDVIANAPVRAADRKTRRRRRTEAREKQEKAAREKAWADKLRENEVFRVKTFISDIKAKEKKLEMKRELRKKKHRMLNLSNVKFTEQDIELKLSDELRGSLRELKPEAGLLTDRYKSLQKRGIIEPRCKRRVPKRRYKIKYQEKRQWREIE